MVSESSNQSDGMIFSEEALPRAGRWLIAAGEIASAEKDQWDLVIDFGGLTGPGGCFSLSRYMYDNRQELVRRASRRIAELGHLRIAPDGTTIQKRLKVFDDLSFWYVSGAYEQCIVRNPDLAEYLKCLAVERLMENVSPVSIDFHKIDFRTRKSISSMAERSGVKVPEKDGAVAGHYVEGRPRQWVRAMARFAVLAGKSLSLLRARRWPNSARHSTDGSSPLFVSYSDNIRKSDNEYFDPVYWSGLQPLVDQICGQSYWAHLFDSGAGMTELEFSRKLQSLGKPASPPVYLFLLEQEMTPWALFRALFLYLRLQMRVPSVERALDQNLGNNGASPWPFLSSAWRRSVLGGSAASLCLQLVLLQKLAKQFSSSKGTFFVSEGMAWERALAHFWRRQNSGPLFGYQHTMIKSFDMRFAGFTLHDEDSADVPRPDCLLVNGPEGRRALSELGMEPEYLRNVEALRFGYLKRLAGNQPQKDDGSRKRVVIMLEGLPEADLFMVKMIGDVLESSSISERYTFVFKPHPNRPVDIGAELGETGRGLIWSETSASIEKTLSEADIAVCSINSSAMVEAQAAGLPTYLVAKSDALVRSPVSIDDWSKVIGTSNDLVALLAGKQSSQKQSQVAELFFLDADLPLWREVLGGL
jgi:surface carbohydrate biosynthesis protein (TIGR04326 family)